MGNSASAADKALRAAATNDVTGLQKIIANLPQPAAQRKLVIDAKDQEGRSCLTIATIKNHHKIMQLLLQNGADVHYINMTAAKRNTALHEAASRGYEEAVVLLLQYGANPFLANSQGETAMELAVFSNFAKVVQKFEQRALFSGTAEFQWINLLFANDFTARHVVIMDHFPFPRPGATALPARRQMWIHSTKKDNIKPKCRVWLDGACVIRSTTGSECVLRLSHNHPEPLGKVFTRFVQGYCLFMRPPRTTAQRASEAGSAWERMLWLCNVSDSMSVSGVEPFFKGASGTAASQALLQLRPTSASAMSGPPGRSTASMPSPHTTSGLAASGLSGIAATPRSYPELVGGVLLMPHPQGMTSSPGGQSFDWRAGSSSMPPPYASPATSTPPRPSALPAAASFNGRPPAEPEPTSALPGESDAAFAARLASLSAGGAASAVDMQALSMATAALSQPPRHGAASSNWPPPPPQAAFHLNAQPSAPPLLMPPAPAQRAQSQDDSGDDSCVICLSAPREAGFLHGGTVHRCVCSACSRIIQADMNTRGTEMPCPLCRQPVEQVITIF